MNKFWVLFLLIITLSSCTKKNDIIVEIAHNDGIIEEEAKAEALLFEGSEKISGEISSNKTTRDIAMWNRFIGGDLGNIKYGIVNPGNSLSLEDWKNNNNESERIKKFFERFCGYYINIVDFGIVDIAKLSIGGPLDNYLILQTVSITDDGFVEGDKIVLDDIDASYVWNYISFIPNNNRRLFSLGYYPPKNDGRYELPYDRIFIDYNNYTCRWDSFNNFFTKNINELGIIVWSIFETQKNYTGMFMFQEYDYYESYNRNDDSEFERRLEQIKKETEQRIIEVNIDENGYLFVSGIINDSSLIDNTIRDILIKDNDRKIYEEENDLSFRSRSLSFYFLNKDTIINEYSQSSGSEDGTYTSLYYKAKYIKTSEIYE
jgi:hypothetical protein